MKKRTHVPELVDKKMDQSKRVFFSDDLGSAYSTYRTLYSNRLSRQRRETALEMAKHVALLALWIGLLTSFCVVQRSGKDLLPLIPKHQPATQARVESAPNL